MMCISVTDLGKIGAGGDLKGGTEETSESLVSVRARSGSVDILCECVYVCVKYLEILRKRCLTWIVLSKSRISVLYSSLRRRSRTTMDHLMENLRIYVVYRHKKYKNKRDMCC